MPDSRRRVLLARVNGVADDTVRAVLDVVRTLESAGRMLAEVEAMFRRLDRGEIHQYGHDQVRTGVRRWHRTIEEARRVYRNSPVPQGRSLDELAKAAFEPVVEVRW